MSENIPLLVFLDFDTISPSISEEQRKFILCQSNVVCLSPAADYWAERNHLKYHPVDEYIDSLYLRKRGMENFETTDKICRALNKILLEEDRFKDIFSCQNPDPSYGFYYKIKIIYDALVIRNEILSKILDYHRPGEIYYFTDRVNEDCCLEDITFSNKQSLYYKVLKDLTARKDSLLKTIPVRDENRRPFKLPQKIIRLNRILQLLKMELNLFQSFGKISKRILLISASYDWEGPLKLLVKSKAAKVYCTFEEDTELFIYKGIKYYFSKLFKKSIFKFLKNKTITQKPAEEDFFYQRLLSQRHLFPFEDAYFNQLFPYLLKVLLDTKMIYGKNFETTKDIMKKYKISAVLSIFIHQPISFMRAKAAQELDIPVCIFQHGGVGFDVQPMYYWSDIYPSNYVFLYGHALDDYYKRLSNNGRYLPLKKEVKYCITGSSLMDSLKNGKTRRIHRNLTKKICLYLLNILQGNTHYLAHKNYKSDIYLWRMQRDVVDIFSHYKDWDFIIKPHPSTEVLYNPLFDYIHERKMDNVVVDNFNTPADIMRCSDLAILDYPATGLIQSMVLKKDIIVFTGYFTVESSLEKRLKDIIYISADKDEFLNLIDSALKGVLPLKREHQYDDFLSKYATHLNDGKSTQRIKDCLLELIEIKNLQVISKI